MFVRSGKVAFKTAFDRHLEHVVLAASGKEMKLFYVAFPTKDCPRKERLLQRGHLEDLDLCHGLMFDSKRSDLEDLLFNKEKSYLYMDKSTVSGLKKAKVNNSRTPLTETEKKYHLYWRTFWKWYVIFPSENLTMFPPVMVSKHFLGYSDSAVGSRGM